MGTILIGLFASKEDTQAAYIRVLRQDDGSELGARGGGVRLHEQDPGLRSALPRYRGPALAAIDVCWPCG